VGYREFKLRFAPWFCCFLGVLLIIWALLEKRGAVTFDDLYPGIAALVAGLFFFALLRYLSRISEDESSESNLSSPDQSADRGGA